MVLNILPANPPEVKGQMVKIHLFSEIGHVTYQIKWYHDMKQYGGKYFAHRPPPLTLGSKGKKSLFQNNVMLHVTT